MNATLSPLIALTRFDKPIGIWLVFFPAAWAVGLVALDNNLLYLMIIMLLGAAVTRAGGCIINDLTDRRLDAAVARTKDRPLASGAVNPWQAIALLAGLALVALLLALSLPPRVFTLALLAVPMIAAYPWMKRFTWWPQLFLGLTFNLSALMGWAATGAPLAPATLLLYTASVLWTLGYDTIYAIQDMKDDADAGIRSSARALGEQRIRAFVTACYGAMIALLTLLGFALMLSLPYYIGLLAAAYLLSRQLTALPCDAAAAGALFRSNQWVGLALLLGILLARFV